LFCFDGTGLWTQVVMLAKQVLYHLNHTSSPTSSLEMKFSPWEKSHTLLCNTGPLCTLSILSCTILECIQGSKFNNNNIHCFNKYFLNQFLAWCCI
jgi:hypothetical protein